MKSQYFDVMILGGGPAPRLAAWLAGRSGRRVLLLDDDPGAWPPQALPCCRHLQRLLPLLGIDRKELGPAGSLQLIGARHRLDLTGPEPEMEWRRELAVSSDGPVRLLHSLATWGDKLSRRFAEQGPGSLFGLSGRISIALRGRLPGRGIPLGAPLSAFLARHADQEPRHLLQDLFSGLSGLPAGHLRLFQAALLWHWACLPQVLDGALFRRSLTHRAQQFHVTEMPAACLESLHWNSSRLDGATLIGGTRIRAERFVFASDAATQRLPKIAGKASANPFAMFQAWRTTPLEGAISPLLAERIVLSGPEPLRVSRHEGEEGIRYLVESGVCSGRQPLSRDHVARRLRPLLPFTEFRLEEIPRPPQPPFRHADGLLAGRLPSFSARRNLLAAVPGRLCPGLGISGEILLGLALAERLR